MNKKTYKIFMAVVLVLLATMSYLSWQKKQELDTLLSIETMHQRQLAREQRQYERAKTQYERRLEKRK